MKRDEIIQTTPIKEAVTLAAALITSASSPIGELVGETGTGKSCASKHILASIEDSKRVCAEESMSIIDLKAQLAHVFGINKKQVYLDFSIAIKEQATAYLTRNAKRLLVVVDEANKLNWKHLEYLRYLADECGLAILLVGTELYERKFQVAQTRELLLQLGRRIGAKRVRFKNLTKEELSAWLVMPAFGQVPAEVINLLWLNSRRGNWGDASELCNTCQRFMSSSNKSALTKEVVEPAAQWMAHAVRDAA